MLWGNEPTVRVIKVKNLIPLTHRPMCLPTVGQQSPNTLATDFSYKVQDALVRCVGSPLTVVHWLCVSDLFGPYLANRSVGSEFECHDLELCNHLLITRETADHV